MGKNSIYVILLPYLATINFSVAQESVENTYVIGLKSSYGFIIPHREELKDVSKSSPAGFQFDLSKQYLTQRTWDLCGCYPRIGLSLNYTNFSNRKVLGSSYSLFSYLEPFISYRGRFQPSFKLGFGLSYLDQVFHESENPLNLFYSTPLSFIMMAEATLRYSIDERWNFIGALTYNHISNGGVKQPNKGINFPMGSVGVEYKLKPVKFIDRVSNKTIRDIHPQRWFYQIQPFFSRKDVVENQGKYTVMGLSMNVSYIFTKMSAVTIGMEAVHDGSIAEKKERFSDNTYNPSNAALLAGHELLMGKFIFSQHLGLYLSKPTIYTNQLYQRIGLQYKINDLLLAGISLKTHTSVADYVDLRIGVRF